MPRHTCRALVLAGIGLALATTAAAQDAFPDTPPLTPGVRVRVSVAASGDRLKGTVQALDERTLSVISDDRTLVHVPRGSITRLETGWGRRGNARKGLVTGALFGAGVGLLVCGVDESGWDHESRREHDATCDGGEWVGLPLAAAATYGGIGALIGHFIKSDRWVEVPIAGARLSLGPPARGLGLSVSLRF